jgi:phosphoglycerate dehydrogenase-like enzyme
MERTVNDPRPRLLVTVDPSEALGKALDARIPEVPWSYVDATPPPSRSDVEAMLVGSLPSGPGAFDPSSVPRLAFVQRMYTGLDRFPFDRFPPQVRVAGNVGAYAPFVAEGALTLALAAGRNLPAAGERLRNGRLESPPDQRTLYGSTAVILGYGEIGREIARRLSAFHARVYGLNRTGAVAEGVERMYPSGQLREAVAEGDFVFEVRPLTKLTAQTIGTAELEAMRPKATFVNVGRAGTVDEEALYRHLETHPQFRAGIDVWWNEDHAKNTLTTRFPFAQLPNLVGTPHSAGDVAGAEARGIRLAVENIARYFQDGRPEHVVDPKEYRG